MKENASSNRQTDTDGNFPEERHATVNGSGAQFALWAKVRRQRRAKKQTLQTITEPIGTLGIQIRNRKRVRQQEVTVESHQWIRIEQNRCHACHQEDVEANICNHAFRSCPHNQRHERDEQLDIHPGARDNHSVPAIWKPPHRSHIDKRHRCKQQQQDAGLRDFSPVAATGNSVSSFVNDF